MMIWSDTIKKIKYIKSYFLVSCLSFSVDYFISFLFIYFRFTSEASLALGTVVGSVIGYLGLELWTFKVEKTIFLLKRFFKYCLGIFVIYVYRIIFLKLICLIFKFSQLWQEALCLFITYISAFVLGYIIQRLFVFKIYKQNE